MKKVKQQKEEQCFTFSVSFLPGASEMAVQPLLPSRVPGPDRMENMGAQREMAAL